VARQRRDGRCRRSTGRPATGLGLAALALLLAACGRTELELPPLCAEYSGRVDLAPLDLVVTLDTSNSMEQKTSDGQRKIDVLRAALVDFATSAGQAGIGIALATFPQMNPDVPDLVFDATDCGDPVAFDPLWACAPSLDGFCATNADCAAGDNCEPIGFCDPAGYWPCRFDGTVGCAASQCRAAGTCANWTRCDPATYRPQSPFRELPTEAPLFVDELRAASPDGATPTLPALQGAIDAAAERMRASPGHKAIVLLATDGFPTACDAVIPAHAQHPTEGIPAVAAAAAAGAAAGVQTFVLGAFAAIEAETARQQLSVVARAGGSTEAQVLETDADLTERFLAALTAIRMLSGTCTYTLPRPGGSPLDASGLTVSLVSADGSSVTVPAVARDECDPARGGYVLDHTPTWRDPARFLEPCPASCARVEAGAAVVVDARCGQEQK